jgi:hypothetical protein
MSIIVEIMHIIVVLKVLKKCENDLEIIKNNSNNQR